MTVRVNKSSFNIREKLSELGRKFGLKGSELVAAETVQEAREIVSAGRRNILVNGSMQIAQRATQVTGSTGAGYKTCDRWRINHSNYGTFTIDQSTDAPPGFAKSLKLTCTTAHGTLGASDNIMVQQRLEGHDLQSLAWGTSSAKEFTISFYVKSSRTGNATFTALNTDNGNIMVSFPYTILSANTWEYKTITVPAYTAGAFDDDNARSMQIEWWLGSGSQYTGAGTHQTQWAALSQTERNASNLGIGGAVNDTWQLAGVQMEIGRNATDFEHRSIGEELALCQRYYYEYPKGNTYNIIANGFANTSSNALFHFQFPVPMRSAPAVATTGNWQVIDGTSHNVSSFSAITDATTLTGRVDATTSGLTVGRGTMLRNNNDATATFSFNAEL
jgi:hypothetical protein